MAYTVMITMIIISVLSRAVPIPGISNGIGPIPAIFDSIGIG